MRLRLTIWILVALLLLISKAEAQSDSGLTDHVPSLNQDGNRMVMGRGTFPAVKRLTLNLDQQPVWLDSVVSDKRITLRYAAQSESRIFEVQFDLTTPDQPRVMAHHDVRFSEPFAGMPALLLPLVVLGASLPDIAPSTQVVRYREDSILYIAQDGRVRLWSEGQIVSQLDAGAMPDSRLVVSEAGIGAVYIEPTERYPHGVLGNSLEAASLLIFTLADGSLLETTRIQLQENEVFEGLSPLWADVDADGSDELVTTVSNAYEGSRLVIYRTDGTPLAESSSIGQGYRWRHQLAFGAFGPNGEKEIVEVQTPHIGGVVQFWRYEPEHSHLILAASTGGYTSHMIGSSNLDQAVAGDFNGDGTPEIVLTTQQRDFAVGLQRSGDGVIEAWSLPLDASPLTNFLGLPLTDGQLALAVGLVNSQLEIWLSRR